jgi:hypothetical protein
MTVSDRHVDTEPNHGGAKRMEQVTGTAKCLWCQRTVNVKDGRYVPHISAPKVQCVGGGQPVHVREEEPARADRRQPTQGLGRGKMLRRRR